jgi:hypothetical protein
VKDVEESDLVLVSEATSALFFKEKIEGEFRKLTF